MSGKKEGFLSFEWLKEMWEAQETVEVSGDEGNAVGRLKHEVKKTGVVKRKSGSVKRGRIDPVAHSVTHKSEEWSPPQLCSYICRIDKERERTPERDADKVWLKRLVKAFRLVNAEDETQR